MKYKQKLQLQSECLLVATYWFFGNMAPLR